MKRGKSFSITAPRMDKESYLDEKAALSPEERELADCDLYGKARPLPEETDEFLTVKFAELESELEKIRDKPAYDLAVERCHDYVKGRDFELLFLRADYFDAAKAATRMVLYWKSKLSVFGEEKAFRKVSFRDLSDDDLASFRNGSYRAMPNRDTAGRAIMYCAPQELDYKERNNMLRLLWCLAHAMLEDPKVQHRGFVVVIFFNHGFAFDKYDRKLDKMMIDHSNKIWPVRFVGFHVCFNSKLTEMILPFALYMMGKEMRARLKLHPGSRIGTRFEELAECGIPRDFLPTSMDGTLSFDFDEWLNQKRRSES